MLCLCLSADLHGMQIVHSPDGMKVDFILEADEESSVCDLLPWRTAEQKSTLNPITDLYISLFLLLVYHGTACPGPS